MEIIPRELVLALYPDLAELCNSDIIVDNGSMICAENGVVLQDHVAYELFYRDRSTKIREIEEEKWLEHVEGLRRRYRHTKSYHNAVRVIARYKNRRVFTPQELEVLRRVISGEISTWDAAKILNRSPSTIYKQIQKLKREGWI